MKSPKAFGRQISILKKAHQKKFFSERSLQTEEDKDYSPQIKIQITDNFIKNNR